MPEVEHPCAECGEPTLNERLCRDCNIERLMDDARCLECGSHIWNANVLMTGMGIPFAHADTCISGRDERKYGEGLVKGWTMAFECGAPVLTSGESTRDMSHSRVVPQCTCGTYRLHPDDAKSSLGTVVCPVHAT